VLRGFSVKVSDNDAPDSFVNLRGGKIALKPYSTITLADRLAELENHVPGPNVVGFGGSRDVDVYADVVDGIDVAAAVALNAPGDPFRFVPTPEDGGFVPPVVPLTLSWMLPEPDSINTMTGPISVEVTWNTDDVGAGGTLVVDADDVLTFDVTDAVYGATYYWKIVATVPYTSGTVVYESPVFLLSTNQGPTIVADPIGYQWLENGTRTVGLTSTVTDADGFEDHIYTWSSDPAGVTFSPNGTNDANDTDAIFDAAGVYILQVEVNDNDEHSITDTITVTVYADGCAAATNEVGYTDDGLYTAAEARKRGDFNHNCEADFEDLSQLALNWLGSEALKY
jgi:hypothetical protein